MKLRLLVAAVLASLGSALLAVPAAVAAAPSLVVTWPDATRFNPDATVYAVEIQADEEAVLSAERTRSGFAPESIAVPEAGPLTIEFPVDGAWTVTVSACGGAECSSSTRNLYVQRRLEVRTFVNTPVAGPLRDPRASVTVRAPGGPSGINGETVELAWRLTPEGRLDTTLSSGSSTFPTGLAGSPIPDLRLPDDSRDGTYVLDIRVSVMAADFGRLEGRGITRIRWDTRAPSPVGFQLSETVFFPVKDGYRDSVRIVLDRGGRVGNDLSVSITNSEGVVVYEEAPDKSTRSVSFDGRDGKRVLPAGTYRVELGTTDRADNFSSTSRMVTLRPEELTWQASKTTFKASELLLEPFEGPCGSLVRSPKGRAKGALGFYSTPGCGLPRFDSVAAVFGARLPDSFAGTFRSFQVSVKGGPARGAKGSEAKLRYYQQDDERYGHPTTLTGLGGKDSGRVVKDPADLVVKPRTTPTVYWTIGTGRDNRFDVTSLTVRVERQLLVDLSGSRRISRTASDAKTIAEPSGAPGPG